MLSAYNRSFAQTSHIKNPSKYLKNQSKKHIPCKICSSQKQMCGFSEFASLQNFCQKYEFRNTILYILFKITLPFILLIVIVLLFLVLRNNFPEKGNKAEIITESELYKIVNKSELSTYQCIYNDICTVKDKDKKLYHCAYEARVNAGIDFSKINITIAKEEDAHWIVNVTIPKVSITDINVDIPSLDYIWEDSSANTDTVSAQAYKACINDVTEKTKSEINFMI